MKRRAFPASMLSIILAASAVADNESESFAFSSGDRQVVLIELFTSEGCSSCPPADNWLSSLERQSGIWSEFIPVSFHVDYWDYIGWRDRFAKPEFSARQRRYADEGPTNVVYTPGVFRNGQEWRGWSRNENLPASGSMVGNLSIEIEDQDVNARFDPTHAISENLMIHVALLAMNLESRVSAGENTGKTLHHNFVVVSAGAAQLYNAEEFYSARLKLPESDPELNASAIVAWVSPRNRQTPIQATGGFLH